MIRIIRFVDRSHRVSYLLNVIHFLSTYSFVIYCLFIFVCFLEWVLRIPYSVFWFFQSLVKRIVVVYQCFVIQCLTNNKYFKCSTPTKVQIECKTLLNDVRQNEQKSSFVHPMLVCNVFLSFFCFYFFVLLNVEYRVKNKICSAFTTTVQFFPQSSKWSNVSVRWCVFLYTSRY